MNTQQAPNVEPAEIDKFNRIASRWWDPDGDFKPLHQINPIRANYIDLRASVAEKAILDVGCGGGLLTEALSQRGAIMTGIDMAEDSLEVAKLHAKESALEIDYRRQTVEELADAQPESYDVITCLEMLEHVPDPASIIRACAKLVKPGGQVFFSTFNRNPKAYALGVVAAEYILNWLPKGTHDYAKFIRPSELCQWARPERLDVKNISGIVYSPLTRSFRIDQHDVDVNYIAHFSKS